MSEGPRSSDPIGWFADVWDQFYRGRGIGWEANPWAWVVEFSVISGIATPAGSGSAEVSDAIALRNELLDRLRKSVRRAPETCERAGKPSRPHTCIRG